MVENNEVISGNESDIESDNNNTNTLDINNNNSNTLDINNNNSNTLDIKNNNSNTLDIKNNNSDETNNTIENNNMDNDNDTSNENNSKSSSNADSVKHVTRRQTRTKEKPEIVSISLYEKFYGILRDMLITLNSGEINDQSSISCENSSPPHTTTLNNNTFNNNTINNNNDNNTINNNTIITNTVINNNIENTKLSIHFRDQIDEFIASNSTSIIYLDVVYRFLKQFVKFDINFALDEWSFELCQIFGELGGLFYNQRDIAPAYSIMTTSFPDEDYVLNAFIMLRVLEVKYILQLDNKSKINYTSKDNKNDTNNNLEKDKINNGKIKKVKLQPLLEFIRKDQLQLMLEFIETVVVFCKVKLNETNLTKQNPPQALLFMVIRHAWLLAHYHMATNPNNYCEIEEQLVKCKNYLQKYALDCINIFPHDNFNVSLAQINLLIESLSVKKKIEGFKSLLDSRNFSTALSILESFNISIPERAYNEHHLILKDDNPTMSSFMNVSLNSNSLDNINSLNTSSLTNNSTSTCISSSSLSSNNIIHANIRKQLELLIKCHWGLGHSVDVVKGVLSSIFFCLNDHKTSIVNHKIESISLLKHLFNYWDIEKGLIYLSTCLNINNVIVKFNLYTDAINQLSNLLTILLPSHGDSWIDLMIVHCVKLLWYTTKSLAISSSKNFNKNSKVKQTIFHMADELINLLMANGQICCRVSYCKWLISEILFDLNDIYTTNAFKSISSYELSNSLSVSSTGIKMTSQSNMIKATIGDINRHQILTMSGEPTLLNISNENNSTSTILNSSLLETSFSDESYRNTMLLYFSCLIGYPSANKIKNLSQNGVVHLNEPKILTANSTANVMHNESLNFSVIMVAFEFFKPTTDPVTLGPYLFKVSSSVIGNSRPALNSELFKLFQLLTNIIVRELELMFHNFKSECKRLSTFIKCRKESTNPLYEEANCPDNQESNYLFKGLLNKRKLPTHLYNSRLVLQFVIEYHLKNALAQGGNHLNEVKKIIAIYLFVAPNDYFGWWATFCYCIYYVNFEVLNYYELQTTINISMSPLAILNAKKQILKSANLALNSLQLAISLCDDANHKFLMQLDFARASLLFSTYEFGVCILGSRGFLYPNLNSNLNEDRHFKEHLKLIGDEHYTNPNFLVSATTQSTCKLCEVSKVRRNFQLEAYKKFNALANKCVSEFDVALDPTISVCGDQFRKLEIEGEKINNQFSNEMNPHLVWYIYYMSYKSYVDCNNSNLNTPKAAHLLLATLQTYLSNHLKCNVEQLDKFLIHQNLSDSSKCFYQLLSGVFEFIIIHDSGSSCTLKNTNLSSTPCFCGVLRHLLDSIMEAVIRVDKNRESVEFFESALASIFPSSDSTTLVNDANVATSSRWPTILSTLKGSPYSCQLHGDNIAIKMCDHHLMLVINKTLIYMIVILKRFYSSYDYVKLITRHIYNTAAKRCCLVNQFLFFLITGNVNGFTTNNILSTKINLEMNSEMFGFAKIIKYLKPNYRGFINLYGRGHLFKHAWRTGIEEIESLDDFQYSVTNVFSLFVDMADSKSSTNINTNFNTSFNVKNVNDINNNFKEYIYSRLALKIDSNTTKSYLLPFKGVAIVRKIFFYLIGRIVAVKNTLLNSNAQDQSADVSNMNKLLYVALKIYKSNILFEKSKRNELLVCLDVIHAKLTNRQVPVLKDYPTFFTSQQKKELFEHVQKYFAQIKYTF